MTTATFWLTTGKLLRRENMRAFQCSLFNKHYWSTLYRRLDSVGVCHTVLMVVECQGSGSIKVRKEDWFVFWSVRCSLRFLLSNVERLCLHTETSQKACFSNLKELHLTLPYYHLEQDLYTRTTHNGAVEGVTQQTVVLGIFLVWNYVSLGFSPVTAVRQ